MTITYWSRVQFLDRAGQPKEERFAEVPFDNISDARRVAQARVRQGVADEGWREPVIHVLECSTDELVEETTLPGT